jgi:hypothetical protein
MYEMAGAHTVNQPSSDLGRPKCQPGTLDVKTGHQAILAIRASPRNQFGVLNARPIANLTPLVDDDYAPASSQPITCGLIYGLLVDLSMTLIVLPFSALHVRGPFPLGGLLFGIGVHMVTVGLPISLTLQRCSSPQPAT